MKKAFTLIELLVVVLIIGILAAVALPQYQVAVLKTRLATTMSAVKSLAQAAEVYYLANGNYPPDSLDDLDISSFSGCVPAAGGEAHCGTTKIDYNGGGTIWHDSYGEDRIDGVVCNKNCTEAGHYNVITYIQYLEHSPSYAGERHCEATDNSALAHKVCKSMGGNLLSGNIYKLP